MENEVIVPFEMTCHDSHGRRIHVVGVEQVKNWVLFRIPGYEHGLCFCPRRDFGTKYKKVKQ